MLGWLGYLMGRFGHRDEASGILRELGDMSNERYVTPYASALVYIGLGDIEHAFKWLERAYEDLSEVLVWLKTEPGLDCLRPDPRFAEPERKVALESGPGPSLPRSAAEILTMHKPSSLGREQEHQ